MGYAQESGYTPTDIDSIMLSIMDNINVQFSTSYSVETFVGTNFYKYFYALAQRMQENEVKTSEIFQKLQEYFDITNERIQRPVVTPPGIIENLATLGYVASVKPMVEADAGKCSICVDADDGTHAAGNITITSYANLVSGTDDSVGVNGTTFTAQVGAATPGTGTFQAATSNNATATSLAAQINAHATVSLVVRARAVNAIVYITAIHGGTAGNSIALAYTDNDTNIGATKSGTVLSGGAAPNPDEYAATKLEIATMIKDSVVAGVVTQGSETETIVLTNGQDFAFKFWLPNRIPVKLKLTTVLSDNNQVVVGVPDDVKQLLLANIAAAYALGRDFEPQRYFSVVDAPWAASVLLEYSFDVGSTWASTVYDAAFDDLFDFGLADITLVES